MADEKKNGNGGWKIRPRDVGGPSIGFFGGMLAHRLAGESSLPVETFEWILKNGSAGFFLVGLAIVSWAYFHERKERTGEQIKHAEKIESLLKSIETNEDRRANRTEEILRENAPLTRKHTRVLAILTEVIRNKVRVIPESDFRVMLEDDSTPDQTKLPPKSQGETGKKEEQP